MQRVCLALALAVGGLLAQQPQPPAQPVAQAETTIRLDVQQVLVPVVVADRKGHHVSGLRASDFHVLEDGVEQRIAAFSSDTAASVDDVGSLAKATPGTPPAPRHTFVICIDTLHTSPLNAGRIRQALEAQFEKEKTADSQYVLIGIGRRMQVLQPATTNPLAIRLKLRGAEFQSMLGGLDAAALATQLNNLRRRMDDFCKRCSCSVRSDRQSCDADVEALKQSVDADAARWAAPVEALQQQFTSVVAELAKLPTARTLILVSDGFNVNATHDFYSAVSAYLPGRPEFMLPSPESVEPGLREALKVAAARNIAIYTVDSRGGSTATLSGGGPMDAGNSAGGAGNSMVDGGGRRNAAPAVRAGGLETVSDRQANAFSPSESADMRQLAAATGGVYFPVGSDMTKDIRSAMADGREYYVIAYVPKNGAPDGKFRRIAVETNDKSLSVRAKSGYWAAGPAQ